MDLLKRIFLRILHISPIAKVVQNNFYRLVSGRQLEISVEEAKNHINSLVVRPDAHAYYNEPLCEVTKTDIDLSIIIPFYKSEAYAEECIKSVLNQMTNYKIEAIFVDDGSPDNCGEICDRWAEKDERVSVIHQKNSGAAVARNIGVKNAKGKYIMFVDSDDCLVEGAIETLLIKAYEKEADIVEGSYQILMGNTKKTRKGICHSEFEGSKGENMYGFPWGKVFKRNLFLQFCFPAGYWCEDAIIANLIFPHAEKTITIPDYIVKYRLNSMGLTAQLKNNVKCLHIYYIMEELSETYQKFSVDYNRNLTVRQLGQYLYTRCSGLDEKEIQAVFVMASDLAEKFELKSGKENYCFYEEQMLIALQNKQYYRWKWASLLI